MNSIVKSQGADMKAMIEKILDELATDSSLSPEKVAYWEDVKSQYVSSKASTISTLAAIDGSSSFKIEVEGFSLEREA